MDSAIPSHLRCPRTRPRRVPDDYVPPYPSFVARHAQRVERVVMAYFGAQSQDRDRAALEEAVQQLARRFAGERRPAHWDRSRYTDEAGFETVVCAAYWDDPASHDAWFAAQGRDWTRVARPGLGTSPKCCGRTSSATRRCSRRPTAPRASPFLPRR